MTDAPERIYHWRNSQLSIARFYGGIQYQGHHYVIVPNEEGQPLVRADVLARERKVRKHRESRERAEEIEKTREAQGDLL